MARRAARMPFSGISLLESPFVLTVQIAGQLPIASRTICSFRPSAVLRTRMRVPGFESNAETRRYVVVESRAARRVRRHGIYYRDATCLQFTLDF
jgi:hypothetical protein